MLHFALFLRCCSVPWSNLAAERETRVVHHDSWLFDALEPHLICDWAYVCASLLIFMRSEIARYRISSREWAQKRGKQFPINFSLCRHYALFARMVTLLYGFVKENFLIVWIQKRFLWFLYFPFSFFLWPVSRSHFHRMKRDVNANVNYELLRKKRRRANMNDWFLILCSLFFPLADIVQCKRSIFRYSPAAIFVRLTNTRGFASWIIIPDFENNNTTPLTTPMGKMY